MEKHTRYSESVAREVKIMPTHEILERFIERATNTTRLLLSSTPKTHQCRKIKQKGGRSRQSRCSRTIRSRQGEKRDVGMRTAHIR